MLYCIVSTDVANSLPLRQGARPAHLERLRALELPEQALARLHAPVGIAIGSKTPIEIAVSIMAELTQLRRARERTG